MCKKYFEPAQDLVLVIDAPRETSLDGIDMPDNQRQQDMASGIVVFVGPKVSAFTKAEDVVCYGPYAGKFVIIDGHQFRSLREGQIEGYIRKSQ